MGPDGKTKIGPHVTNRSGEDGQQRLKYDAACGRGTYTTPDFKRALSYAAPHGQKGLDSLLRLVPLLRIPGNERVIGEVMQRM